MIKTEPFVLNMGPQHPSTHGVFRLRLVLDGETVLDAEPVMGYLHRSKEKLEEERTYLQTIPITDRMDYLNSMGNNLAVTLAIEKLADISVPERATYLRVIFVELQRIASHLFAQGAFLNDCGAWATPFMYMLREREKIVDLFEMVCGARLTYNYIRPGGVTQDVPPEFFPAMRKLLEEMPHRIDEYEQLLVENEILLARSKGIGVLPRELAIASSASGPVLRASGVAWDLRKADPYCCYDRFDFDIPVGQNGDSYDRFWVRLEEMRQSVRITNQALEQLPPGSVRTPVPIVIFPPPGDVYARVESPRGELGFYVVSDGSPAPWRMHVRAPSFVNLTPLREMLIGHKVADVVAILGSIDIIMGDVDR